MASDSLTHAQVKRDIQCLLKGFDEGLFIRNTKKDANAAWAFMILPYIAAMDRLRKYADAD